MQIWERTLIGLVVDNLQYAKVGKVRKKAFILDDATLIHESMIVEEKTFKGYKEDSSSA